MDSCHLYPKDNPDGIEIIEVRGHTEEDCVTCENRVECKAKEDFYNKTMDIMGAWVETPEGTKVVDTMMLENADFILVLMQRVASSIPFFALAINENKDLIVDFVNALFQFGLYKGMEYQRRLDGHG